MILRSYNSLKKIASPGPNPHVGLKSEKILLYIFSLIFGFFKYWHHHKLVKINIFSVKYIQSFMQSFSTWAWHLTSPPLGMSILPYVRPYIPKKISFSTRASNRIGQEIRYLPYAGFCVRHFFLRNKYFLSYFSFENAC